MNDLIFLLFFFFSKHHNNINLKVRFQKILSFAKFQKNEEFLFFNHHFLFLRTRLNFRAHQQEAYDETKDELLNLLCGTGNTNH